LLSLQAHEGDEGMGTLTIRSIDDEIKEKLRVLAARNGRSMEAEVRALIEAAVAEPAEPQRGLASLIRRDLEGLDLPPIPEPDRREMPRYAVFD
jgi:plasmid stability protein